MNQRGRESTNDAVSYFKSNLITITITTTIKINRKHFNFKYYKLFKEKISTQTLNCCNI
jgi:hypothetical protein